MDWSCHSIVDELYRRGQLANVVGGGGFAGDVEGIESAIGALNHSRY
jgi:hypothetical protein